MEGSSRSGAGGGRGDRRPATGPNTGLAGGQGLQPGYPSLRPLTATAGAGYSSSLPAASFGPPCPQPPPSAAEPAVAFPPTTSVPIPPLAPREPSGPEDAARDMERGVHSLLEASARAAAGGDWPAALERAKEASRRERALTRHREAHGLGDHVNAELGYAVALNLAAAYRGHGMLDEALQAYQVLVRNKALHPLQQQQSPGGGAVGGAGGWLRVDMGNVCYAQGKFAEAVKMHRMALDQVPQGAHKETRLKIYRNIGHAFVRLGRFHEAIQAYEMVVMNPCLHPQPLLPGAPDHFLVGPHADGSTARSAAGGGAIDTSLNVNSAGGGGGSNNNWGPQQHGGAGNKGAAGAGAGPPSSLTPVGGSLGARTPRNGTQNGANPSSAASITMSFTQQQHSLLLTHGAGSALLGAAGVMGGGALQQEAAVFGDYFSTALDLILCYYALGDAERMRRGFLRVVAAYPPAALAEEDEDEELEEEEEQQLLQEDPSAAAATAGDHRKKRSSSSSCGPDALRRELRRRRAEGERCVLTAARLIAPVLDPRDWSAGYTWLVEAVRRGNHEGLASQVELERGLAYLRRGQLEEGVSVLRAFQKKDKRARRLAAAGLSFLHALEGNGAVAERFARLALTGSEKEEEEGAGRREEERRRRRGGRGPGMAAALVNLGNSLVMQLEQRQEEGDGAAIAQQEDGAEFAGDGGAATATVLARARALYEEALAQDSECLEAAFNLGLVSLRLGRLTEAHAAYERIHSRIPQCPEALYQLGHIAELRGQTGAAIHWFELLRSSAFSSAASGAEHAAASPDTAAAGGGSGSGITAAAAAAAVILPTPASDPGLLARLGALYDRQGDEVQAYRCFTASDCADPGQLEVLSWLGGFHAGREEFDAALGYFARAEAVAPADPQWPLLQAGCRRRGGNFLGAMAGYERVHARFPEHRDCLRCLVQLCRDLGRPCDGYRQALERLERRAGVAVGDGGAGEGGEGRGQPPLAPPRGLVDYGFGGAVLLP